MTSDPIPLFERRGALLEAWVSKQREIAVLQAESAALLAERWEIWAEEVAAQPMHRDAIERSMFAEYAAAGHLSKGSMEFAFVDARTLYDVHPATRRSHEQGLITPAHVRAILREAQPVREAIDAGTVDAGTLNLYEAAVLEVAEADTPARTRAHARQVAAALAGVTVVEQHTRARSEREITVRSVGEGMALLQAVLPEHLAVAILDRLTALARHQRRHPEDRPTCLPAAEPTDAEWAALDAWILWIESHQPDDDSSAGADADKAGDPAAGTRAESAVRNDERSGAIFHGDTFTTDPFTRETGSHEMRSPTGVEEADTRKTNVADSPVDEDPFPFGLPPLPDLDSDPRTNPDSPLLIRLPDDSRTIDQLRADLFTDLLLASDPSAAHGTGMENIHATIQVTVAATTLRGDDDKPAQLDGHGPLHPDTARALAGVRTGWTRLFLDPTGMLTQTDTYTPTEPMRRYLRARDQHCRFPGCRQPVHRCDIDHNHDYALGGPTAIDNLAHFCRAHHVLKHPDIPETARWRARQLPDQTVQWISPTGRTYPDPAPRRVMFVPSDSSEPSASTEPLMSATSSTSADRPTSTAPPGSAPPPGCTPPWTYASSVDPTHPTATEVGAPF
ncbi:HNH endonuclease signature motif containing protein [Microbacterium suwonense]|uniref:HNH nuclease domain-containing protein n=1 Tax=Microbacterium suwonense TaxID=683047 RepID=A0ABM8FQA8_9MICO|nr:HNH endonuclease signature motif containing protein [Microbacterium suwonense]BDZ37843.1 hypothetical protein GCM10025863_04570 [Microbacterium suwonense]